MNPFCPFYELRFTYNDKGYVMDMANYENDSLYNCTAENCGDIGVSYFEFEPNEFGDVLSFSGVQCNRPDVKSLLGMVTQGKQI